RWRAIGFISVAGQRSIVLQYRTSHYTGWNPRLSSGQTSRKGHIGRAIWAKKCGSYRDGHRNRFRCQCGDMVDIAVYWIPLQRRNLRHHSACRCFVDGDGSIDPQSEDTAPDRPNIVSVAALYFGSAYFLWSI